MLTRADIAGRKMVNAIHLDMARGESAWMGGVEGLPRLGVYRHNSRKGTTLTWSVDKEQVRDLDAALAVLNGAMTLEEAMQEAEQAIPPEAQRPSRVSIEAQIAEVDYELSCRDRVYPGIAGRDARKKSELDLHVDRMKAVRVTLAWLRDNEAAIKQRMSY